jgi:hypothetical protein
MCFAGGSKNQPHAGELIVVDGQFRGPDAAESTAAFWFAGRCVLCAGGLVVAMCFARGSRNWPHVGELIVGAGQLRGSDAAGPTAVFWFAGRVCYVPLGWRRLSPIFLLSRGRWSSTSGDGGSALPPSAYRRPGDLDAGMGNSVSEAGKIAAAVF